MAEVVGHRALGPDCVPDNPAAQRVALCPLPPSASPSTWADLLEAEWAIGRGSSRLGYLGGVARKVWTAAEKIAELTPAEQDDLFNSSVVKDLSEVPDELLAQVRARLVEAHIRDGLTEPAVSPARRRVRATAGCFENLDRHADRR